MQKQIYKKKYSVHPTSDIRLYHRMTSGTDLKTEFSLITNITKYAINLRIVWKHSISKQNTGEEIEIILSWQ